MYKIFQHFLEGKPTEKYPDPLPTDPTASKRVTPVRPPPRRRPSSEPPKKRRILSELDIRLV